MFHGDNATARNNGLRAQWKNYKGFLIWIGTKNLVSSTWWSN